MQQVKGKIEMYRREGHLAIKHMWIVVLIFAVVQVIVSIAVAAANSSTESGGYKSASFAAIWSMFLVIMFTGLGAKIVFGGRSSALLVGFLLGAAAMLTELFFVLMVMFFVLGQNANTNGYATAPSDTAYAAFSLLNMVIYFVWAIILAVHRNTIINEQTNSIIMNLLDMLILRVKKYIIQLLVVNLIMMWMKLRCKKMSGQIVECVFNYSLI